MKIPRYQLLILLFLVALLPASADEPQKVLFIGNSFTFGLPKEVYKFHPEVVTDLNHSSIGGVPAIFQVLSTRAGLHYYVSLETAPGQGLDFHFAKKADLLRKHWDIVSMHGYSTLDKAHPGNPDVLVQSAKQVADLLHEQNPAVKIYLMATWARADQTYLATGHWYGKPLDDMTKDLRAGYDKAAAGIPYIQGVIPVGEAWSRAFATGFADPNPYDGIEPGKVNLWARDNYHASAFGSYLEALMLFGGITGHDPRSLGATETAAADLGISPEQAVAMQKIAYDELTAGGNRKLIPFKSTPSP